MCQGRPEPVPGARRIPGDGLGPDGLAAATLNIARRARAMQSGYLYHYAFAMLIGVAVIVSWFLFRAWG